MTTYSVGRFTQTICISSGLQTKIVIVTINVRVLTNTHDDESINSIGARAFAIFIVSYFDTATVNDENIITAPSRNRR
jgi:hypothetical protein